MKILGWMLSGLAIWLCIVGLWDHEWRLILAGVVTSIAWPLLSEDVQRDG